MNIEEFCSKHSPRVVTTRRRGLVYDVSPIFYIDSEENESGIYEIVTYNYGRKVWRMVRGDMEITYDGIPSDNVRLVYGIKYGVPLLPANVMQDFRDI